MAELMSVRGYAKSRGIAHTSVGYQIKKRNIPLVDGKVDAEYMDHVFKEKVDAKQSLRGRGQQRVGGGLPTAPAAAAPTLPDDPDDLEAIRRRVPKDYNEAAYLDSVEKLMRARAANAEMEGRLADAEKVQRAQFEIMRQVRDLMMAIPSRVDEVLAAEPSAAGCRRILEGEIRQALEEAAKQAARLTEEDGALDEDGGASTSPSTSSGRTAESTGDPSAGSGRMALESAGHSTAPLCGDPSTGSGRTEGYDATG